MSPDGGAITSSSNQKRESLGTTAFAHFNTSQACLTRKPAHGGSTGLSEVYNYDELTNPCLLPTALLSRVQHYREMSDGSQQKTNQTASYSSCR
jgi:hypothetical protein